MAQSRLDAEKLGCACCAQLRDHSRARIQRGSDSCLGLIDDVVTVMSPPDIASCMAATIAKLKRLENPGHWEAWLFSFGFRSFVSLNQGRTCCAFWSPSSVAAAGPARAAVSQMPYFDGTSADAATWLGEGLLLRGAWSGRR